MNPKELTHQIIGAAIEVHRELGPGKPETAYEFALSHELSLRGIPHQVQKALPVIYKGIKLDCGYRIDLLVAGSILLEIKAIEAIHPIHKAQVLTYLKLGGWRLALLLNFHVAVLRDGISRVVLRFADADEKTAETQRTQRRLPPRDIQTIAAYSGHCGDIEVERLGRHVVDAAIEVHRELGPGLLPSVYEACLCRELHLRGISFERKKRVPLTYKTVTLPTSDELDLIVSGQLIVQPRALPHIEAVNEAILLSQIRNSRLPLGLLINFNTTKVAKGIHRIVNSNSL